MGYIEKMPSTESPEQGKLYTTSPKPRLKRSLSLPHTDRWEEVDPYEEYYRQRSNSVPSKAQKTGERSHDDIAHYDENAMSDRRMLAIMTNVAHIIIGIAITQLGIVGTWYQHYMNFERDQLRHVVYVCVLFIVLGIYGMFVITKRLAVSKTHRITYITLASLSIMASSIIFGNGIRMVIADTYRTKQTVILIFDGLMLGLSGLEIPATLIGLYATTSKVSILHYSRAIDGFIDEKPTGSEALPSWGSIFSIILNMAHIVLGLCIIELGMVGMMYRNFMNIDGTGLFAVVFISFSFVSVGAIGIYNQVTNRTSITRNRSMYTCASLLAIGCATTIMSLVSIAMSSSKYYDGIEAIVAFDVMILSMSSIELIVGIAATALCLIPLCISRYTNNSRTADSVNTQ